MIKTFVLVLNVDVQNTGGSLVDQIICASKDRSVLEKKMKKLEREKEFRRAQKEIMGDEGMICWNGADVTSVFYSIDEIEEV